MVWEQPGAGGMGPTRPQPEVRETYLHQAKNMQPLQIWWTQLLLLLLSTINFHNNPPGSSAPAYIPSVAFFSLVLMTEVIHMWLMTHGQVLFTPDSRCLTHCIGAEMCLSLPAEPASLSTLYFLLPWATGIPPKWIAGWANIGKTSSWDVCWPVTDPNWFLFVKLAWKVGLLCCHLAHGGFCCTGECGGGGGAASGDSCSSQMVLQIM